MKRRRLPCLAILVLLGACSPVVFRPGPAPPPHAPPSSPARADGPLNKRLIVFVSDPEVPVRARTLMPELQREVVAQGAEAAWCWFASQVLTDQTFEAQVREAPLRELITRLLPADYDGLVLFDFEGEIKAALHAAEYKGRRFTEREADEAARRVFNRAAAIVHEMRAQARVGFYAIPVVYGWQVPEPRAVRMAAETIARLDCDVICPSVYDTVMDAIDGTARKPAHMRRRALEVQVSVEASRGRPVLAFVNERIDSKTNSKADHGLIPEDEFIRDQVLLAFENGADGVIWWGQWNRSIAKNTWRGLPDARTMNKPQATEYLLETLPRRYSRVLLETCRTWTP